ncbi:hypothetical protein FFWV33_07365 [Flavobacterium faecale]|uniref:Alpha-2-macroglobulin domain-containing protein n=1 Tax=Flavobacterium faecale TaxID=1355330 RepID=A0A2S1LCD6_9FLAO|nr:MG2 domain-containing protein [Flavobacterium faecale]AWG21357.1 hypothetical protein FFWV33_07365 [Flavobacterium faecale]
MKKYILALLLLNQFLFAQNFDKKWEAVIAMEKEGKIKSADAIVDGIYKKAVAKKDEVTIIKCFFFKSKYLQVLDENSKVTIISNLQNSIKKVSIPSKAILNLVSAKYLQGENNYFYDSTMVAVDTVAVLNDSIAVATIAVQEDSAVAQINNFEDFENTNVDIDKAFDKTLENELLLKKTPLLHYKEIFEFYDLNKFEQETLLDFILKENITYYTSKLNEWEYDPKDFIDKQNILFGNSHDFTSLNLEFSTNKSLKKTLSLYQKLELNSPTIDNKLARILFCSRYLIKSDDALLSILQGLENETTNIISLQKIREEKATIYARQASKTVHPDYNILAIKELDKIIAENNQSNAYFQAIEHRAVLSAETIQVNLQQYTYHQENARAYILYKNANNINISFYKINKETFDLMNDNNIQKDSLANLFIQKKLPVLNQEYQLENKNDYFEYSTEVLLPKLDKGLYLVYFENKTNHDSHKSFGFESIIVSNISVLASTNQGLHKYTVIDRKTGQPIAHATLSTKDFKILTNQDGIATYKNKVSNNFNSYPLTVTTENDTIEINRNYLPYKSTYSEEDISSIHKGKVTFYLDRAIYRPGQTVYFKDIAIQKKGNNSSIISKIPFKLSIKNPNYETIKELQVYTNEFGSFSGEFILPKIGLTGEFILQAEESEGELTQIESLEEKTKTPFWDTLNLDYSSIRFKVEEYKRPKFEIIFEPTVDPYKLNDIVKIKGNGKSFAGSAISNAKVSYTVTRNTNSYRNYYNHQSEEILVTSETTTDSIGNFIISFKAVPSSTDRNDKLPVFNYEVNATLTDSNGETHSTQTTIKIGYHDLILNASIPQLIETDQKNEIIISSTNLNNQFTNTKGELNLYYLGPISKKFKPRTFQKPEIKTITDAEFELLFPYEIYISDNDTIQEEQLLFSTTFDTEKSKKVKLDFIKNYKSGHYKIIASSFDNFKNNIESSTTFQIKQNTDKYVSNQLFTVKQVNSDPKKDGYLSLKITSSIPTLYIAVEGNYRGSTFYENSFHLQNNVAIIKIPVDEKFKNSIGIGFQSQFENDNFSQQLQIALKEISPTLSWTIESMRSKIDPGQIENWSFKLNTKNTQKESEVLASMYDRSLDQFTKVDWQPLGFHEYNYNNIDFSKDLSKATTYTYLVPLELPQFEIIDEQTRLNWFGFYYGMTIHGDPDAVLTVVDAKVSNSPISIKTITLPKAPQVDQVKFVKPVTAKAEEIVVVGYGTNKKEKDSTGLPTTMGNQIASQVKTRTNLSETAFFFPHLRTDNKGTISFNFTSPEALTAWKLRLFAHNKNAVSGYMEQNVITQKELMVTPNFPRFLREKDTITITTKISNMTAQPKTGLAVLQLFDATTMQPIDSKMMNIKTTQNFSVNAMGNTTASWKIVVPVGVQALQYKVLAKAGNYSDGEENIIPVLTNSMLVTESIPVWVRENSTKEYTFENLKNNSSTTLRNHQLTLEYTSNPTWMALQSLPYLMEYEHECAEQTFARFYANAMATTIINSNPKIATLFEDWRKNGKLNSKLEVNEELKSILLAETPWLNDAKTEDEKKQQLATLFDLEKMKNSQEVIFSKLQQKQKASGGFAWFDGSDENEYITRHILAGLGHLEKLSTDAIIAESVATIAAKGIPYVDSKFIKNYNLRIKNSTESGKLIWLNTSTDLHYLYTRSFYLKAYPLGSEVQKATQANIAALKKDWLNYTLYEKGMAALVLHRFGDKETAKKIITSLKETASNNEDWGMYWIANKSGWYWYQAPIEMQALLIEAFTEVTNDTKAVNAMKVWLLKNKQTKNWPTTKATTEAVYALLLQGSDWLSVKDNTKISIGDQKIFTKKLAENEKEAETGYLKINWKADEIKKDMATIVIENKSKVPGYGGIYWQYFEVLDNIKSNTNTSLSVNKELYLKKATDKGNVLQKISTTNNLKIGDLVTVRLVVATKEDMEFVHLKDLRASCFEPIDVLSGYEYKGGLGFYKSTKDVATHFFFDKINKGTYVLEYDIRVNNKGDFSNGITTIQSMYAPEFSSHSKGIRVNVKE